MHVAAKVLIGKALPLIVSTSVWTFDAETQSFLKHCTADIAQSADRIASALNACVNIKPENLTPGRIETLVLENDKQRHTIHDNEAYIRAQSDEIAWLRRRIENKFMVDPTLQHQTHAYFPEEIARMMKNSHYRPL